MGQKGEQRSFYSVGKVTCFRLLMDSCEGEFKPTASIAPIRNKCNGGLVRLYQQRGWEHVPADFAWGRQGFGGKREQSTHLFRQILQWFIKLDPIMKVSSHTEQRDGSAFITYKLFRGCREKLERWDFIQNNCMNNRVFLEDELHGLGMLGYY